ncbi:MAG: VCBS repeat-containing protein, partial [Gemmataceae bacterium]
THGSAAFELLNSRPVQIEGSGQKLDPGGAISIRLFTVGAGVTLGLRNLELLNGWASEGGAVYNLGAFTATACTFANNTAIVYSSLGNGGAIYNRGGSVSLDNCTVTGNSIRPGPYGRVTFGGYGGGIYNEDGSLTLRYVTVADNVAQIGQQVYSRQTSGTAAVRIDHSILSQAGGNTRVVTGVPLTGEFASSALVVEHPGASGVGNLVRGAYGFGGQVLLTVDPRLRPLANNGGWTRTRGLAADSPAIDAGELFPWGSLPDQLGTNRSGGGAFTDLGAFEFRGGSERPAPPMYAGSGPGSSPQVRRFDTNANLTAAFVPFDPAFTGGVRVAKADFNRDGVPDMVAAAGPGGGPHVRVLDGATGVELLSLFAFDPGFRGGVSVAAGDISGDGVADLICGAGPGGGPYVRVLDGVTGAEIRSFFAYAPGFRGGVSVGYANGWTEYPNFDFGQRDALAAEVVYTRGRIVTGAGPGGGPHVRVFDAATGEERRTFYAFDPGFRGGVSVAAGDVNRIPWRQEPNVLVGAGPGGG